MLWGALHAVVTRKRTVVPCEEQEDAYVEASIAGCNVVLHPVCGCALAAVAIKDIAEGEEVLTSYGVGAWMVQAKLLGAEEAEGGAEAETPIS